MGLSALILVPSRWPRGALVFRHFHRHTPRVRLNTSNAKIAENWIDWVLQAGALVFVLRRTIYEREPCEVSSFESRQRGESLRAVTSSLRTVLLHANANYGYTRWQLTFHPLFAGRLPSRIITSRQICSPPAATSYGPDTPIP
jgi:hypothetical protein